MEQFIALCTVWDIIIETLEKHSHELWYLDTTRSQTLGPTLVLPLLRTTQATGHIVVLAGVVLLVTVEVISCGSTSGMCGEDGNGFSSSSNSQYVVVVAVLIAAGEGGVAAVLVAVGCGCTRSMIVAVYAIAVMVIQWC